ncbi:hypothetical protein [Anaerocolumna sp. MB42-C2]|uniref:hypothetical protein n=1 Tax=Anaerocolumna sp. MB42-C2 TaxID=3070997 RepID=UPI0027DF16CB|nr:hypothetical protein [Anaerocolumna sp. MB42-C2]WMJ89437.1 hypothetical protein RBU59_07910 [Anaerocolumna sp. MB42-C2]
MNIIDYVSETYSDREFIFIKGHLYLEGIMSELIKKLYPNPNSLNNIDNSFFKKVKLIRAVNGITDEMEKLLLEVNSIRNKMAHNLHYKLSFDDFFELVLLSVNAHIDYSDDGIFKDKEYSKKEYFENSNFGVQELMSNTFSKLVDNENMFSISEISSFLC